MAFEMVRSATGPMAALAYCNNNSNGKVTRLVSKNCLGLNIAAKNDDERGSSAIELAL